MILCDTNIVVEIFKGNKEIIELVETVGLDNVAISSITVMELYYGVLNKRELNKIKKNLKAIQVINIDHDISKMSIKLTEQYSKSHGLQIPDAIIAATAIVWGVKIYTLNLKDFKYIEGLKLMNR
jgi:predicted nucleic acid-binding protein